MEKKKKGKVKKPLAVPPRYFLSQTGALVSLDVRSFFNLYNVRYTGNKEFLEYLNWIKHDGQSV